MVRPVVAVVAELLCTGIRIGAVFEELVQKGNVSHNVWKGDCAIVARGIGCPVRVNQELEEGDLLDWMCFEDTECSLTAIGAPFESR